MQNFYTIALQNTAVYHLSDLVPDYKYQLIIAILLYNQTMLLLTKNWAKYYSINNLKTVKQNIGLSQRIKLV